MALSAEELLAKASIRLLKNSPLFGVLLFKMRKVERDDIPTCAVDGVHLFYNASFVSGLSLEEMEAVLAHEVMHIANMHHLRRHKRHPVVWNIAGDFAINLIVREAGFKLPSNCLFNAKYKDWSTEAIFDDIMKDAKDKGQNGQPGEPGGPGGDQSDPMGEVWDHPDIAAANAEDCPDKAAAERAVVEAEVECHAAVADAARIAKVAGKLPASLDRLIGTLTAPKVNWQEVLRRFVQQVVPTDFSYRRPNKRLLPAMYAPTVVKEGCGNIVFVADTSGSVGDEDMAQFISEAKSIIDEVLPETTYLVSCDAKVQKTDSISRGDSPEDWGVLAAGGGGTDFRPPFRWVENEGVEPECLIYITDGYGPFPDNAPEYPVLWVMTTEIVPPWGESIKL